MLSQIKTDMLNSNDDEVKALANEIFNSEEGQKIVDEFLEKRTKKYIKITKH
jgi:hypothetical protein